MSSVENAILASFLFAAYGSCEGADKNMSDAFDLDPEFFSTPLKRRIAERINEETRGEKFYDALLCELDDAVAATNREALKQEFVEVMAANPLSLKESKRLYDNARKERVCLDLSLI